MIAVKWSSYTLHMIATPFLFISSTCWRKARGQTMHFNLILSERWPPPKNVISFCSLTHLFALIIVLSGVGGGG